MFLVAGLAVAGLVGIAAAFYFSIRSGNRRDKRVRSAGAGRAETGRRPATRSSTARPDLASHPRRAASGGRPVTTFRPAAVSSRNSRAEADTGPDPLPGFGQVPAGGRRAAPGATATRAPRQAPPEDPLPGDPAATDPKLGTAGETRPVARLSRDAHAAGGAARTAKPRRRVGFRKGADLDEELWPTETFGGVSDEQFWDDLASDKPLATTARTAQQDSPGKNRSPGGTPGTGLDTGPATDPQAVKVQPEDRKRDDRAPGGSRRGSGSGAYAAPRTGPGPAAERTAIQPAYAATQPVQSMRPQAPGATQPIQTTAASSQPGSAHGQPGSAHGQPGSTPRQPASAASRSAGAAPPPAETRGRRRASSAEEDPLTSTAFSLRASGPVDGRSSLRSSDTRSGGSGPAPAAGSYGSTSPYLYTGTTYSDPSSVTQAMNTPPYGENYGYGNRGSVPPGDDQRRQNGTRSHRRRTETGGEGTRPVRQAYPQDSYPNGNRQGTADYPAGEYPGNGYPVTGYPGNGYQPGGYPGSGYPGNGQRPPYDPRMITGG